METITNEQLRGIIQASKHPAVSIFMPTHKAGRDVRQDPIELKNLLREAEDKLVGGGMRPTEARDLLEPGRLLLEDAEFWAQNDAGLAVYIAPEFFRAYRVPIEVEQVCVVNERFDVKPLLGLLEGKRFYILAVSDNNVRLLECTPRTCQKVDLPEDVETSFKGAIRGGLDSTPGTNRHSGDASNPQSAGGAFHGMAEEIQREVHEDHMFYYRQLDEGVRKVLREEKDCVILAAADSVTPFYRQASQLKNISDEFIHGNAEHVPNETLHEQGCAIMEPAWHKELNELQNQFGTAISHNLASRELNEIIPAASMGRVGILFVSTGSTHWGKINENNEVVEADPSEPGVEDLIDRAAVETILTSGQVVVVKPEEMPGNGELAAIYRY
jgi:hypothetical protein